MTPEATSRAPFRRALVIGNPIAGRGRGESSARALSDGLRRQGLEVELHLTRARGDGVGRVAARHNDVDLVVSVGGDGFTALKDGTAQQVGVYDVDALYAYFQVNSPVSPRPSGRIVRVN